MHPAETPQQVRSWYGLSGEIVIEHDHWHLVKVASVPLPHPPLVNLFIRRGLPAEERRRLSYWHEFGHLQTLPVAVIHAAWLLRFRSWRRLPWRTRLWRLAAMLLAHEAVWELASEAYVVHKAGRDYRRIYRQHPNRWLTVFWTGMSALALMASWFAGRFAPAESPSQEVDDEQS